MSLVTKITHWLPIITFCPVNNLPDPLFITLTFKDEFVELYKVRKDVRKLLSGKTLFMEDVANKLDKAFPNAAEIEVKLWFSKHTVILKKASI